MKAAVLVPVFRCVFLLFAVARTFRLVYLQSRSNEDEGRKLVSYPYYFEATKLGKPNPDLGLGNPMKGLCGNPDKIQRDEWPAALAASLHLHKRGFDEVMLNDPDIVGSEAAYNWTVVEEILDQAAKFFSHAIIRFYIHWPGKPLSLPGYLHKDPYKVLILEHNGEEMPWFGDASLRKAIQQFLYEFGKKYDADTRIFSIQAGFLGAWGEGHTQGCIFEEDECAPEYVFQELVSWYGKAFKTTHVQFRRPERLDAYDLGFGFHDDSFTYITVGGEPNDGFDKNHIFWTAAEQSGTSEFWKWAPMGGEMRPDNEDVFTRNYPAGTKYHQPFDVCTEVTHTTYIAWGRGFQKGGVEDSFELDRAIHESARMGYNFQVDKVSVATSVSNDHVDIDVTLKQTGVAPFYYPLLLNLVCDGSTKSSTKVTGDLSVPGSTVICTLKNVPATLACLKSVELKLGSNYLYGERPIKWAQGSDGRVLLSIPLPVLTLNDSIAAVPSPVSKFDPSAPASSALTWLPSEPTRLPAGPTLLQSTSTLTSTWAPSAQTVIPSSLIDSATLIPNSSLLSSSPSHFVTSTPSSDFDNIGECFLVCAASVCNVETMGHELFPLLEEIKISLQTTGKELSIRCYFIEAINQVEFKWLNLKQTEFKEPWSMGGNSGKKFTPVPYLSFTGQKIVIVKALRGSSLISKTKLRFTMVA